MIFVMQDDRGEYDDWETWVETVIEGPEETNFDKLRKEFLKTKPKNWRWVTGKFADWLVKEKGFNKIDYRLFQPLE